MFNQVGNAFQCIAAHTYNPIHAGAVLFNTSGGLDKTAKNLTWLADCVFMLFAGTHLPVLQGIRDTAKTFSVSVNGLNLVGRPKDLLCLDKPRSEGGTYFYERSWYKISKTITLTVSHIFATLHWVFHVLKLASWSAASKVLLNLPILNLVATIGLKSISDAFMIGYASFSILDNTVTLETSLKPKIQKFTDAIIQKNKAKQDVSKEEKELKELNHKAKKCWLDIAASLGKIALIVLATYFVGTWGLPFIVSLYVVPTLWKMMHDKKVATLADTYYKTVRP